MPNNPNYNVRPITQQPLGTALASDDVITAVDVSDKTQSPSGTSKKYTISFLGEYLQDRLSGSNKTSCIAASTTNLNAIYLNGDDGVGATLANNGALTALTLDGYAVQLNDRVLIKNQTNETENGIYVQTTVGTGLVAWVLTRADDYDNSPNGDIVLGDFLGVIEGDTQALTFWFQTEPSPIVIGTDDIIFEQPIIAGDYTGTTNQINISMGHQISIATNPVIPGLDVSEVVVTDGSGALQSYPYTDLETANTLVRRDASANFSANVVKADLEGNADTATVADTATNITVNEATDDAEYIVTLVGNTAGDLPPVTSGFITFNPDAQRLTVTGPIATQSLTASGDVLAQNLLSVFAFGTEAVVSGSSVQTVNVPGMTGGELVYCYPVNASANPYYITAIAAGTDGFDVAYNTNPGAGGQMNYVVWNVPV